MTIGVSNRLPGSVWLHPRPQQDSHVIAYREHLATQDRIYRFLSSSN